MVLGTTLFVFTEVMFFSGLISAYLILRSHAGLWPPPGQPRLPIEVTGVNTMILLISFATMWQAARSHQSRDRALSLQWLTATLALGATFLAIQGYEWLRLFEFGLTTTSSIYCGLFYTLVGAHALHVVGGLLALGVVLKKTTHGTYSAAGHASIRALRVYWSFVVILWPVLYVLVYLW